MEKHFIFPLGTVLFPGGTLPLKIFEQRYLEMTKLCIRDSKPFGVCLISEGAEVGTPAVPEAIGCLATIEQWDMPELGMFTLLARGGERFRLLDTDVAPNGLISGSIERLPVDTTAVDSDAACRDVLQIIIDRVGASHFPQPLQLDDPTWVSYRLAEVLPIDVKVKQSLLEIDDTQTRLQRVRQVLADNGLIES